jgi:cobyrinic acid a,c-diamide synthase
MARVSRVAVGTIQPDADLEPIVWALMEALRRSGLQVQSFHSRACFPARQAAAAVTGLTPRHLDSWLMSPEMCRDVFLRGAHAADLAVVEGQFDPAMAADDGGGKLETLCQWLSLPRLVVLDAAKLCNCRLPPQPKAEGLLLDQVADAEQLARLSTDLESLWGVPVIGALDRSSRLSDQLIAVARGGRLSQETCRELGDQFMRYWQVGRLLELASRWEMPDVTLQQLCPEPTPSRLSLAVAYDEAFNRYFPDTLDWLELRGASVVDFSPLREESLPAGTDIVYLGCGQPERHAAALAENHCMKAALRNHLRAGRRIYAEGGGVAYLCQQMESLDGDFKRMVGIISAAARLTHSPLPPRPVEVTLARPNWLADKGERLRGYLGSHWELEPIGELRGSVVQPDYARAILGPFQAVGSLLHLNFAAQPDFLRRFFHPQLPELGSSDLWTLTG